MKEPQISIILRAEDSRAQERSLNTLLPKLHSVLDELGVTHEILLVTMPRRPAVADDQAKDGAVPAVTAAAKTRLEKVAQQTGCRVLLLPREQRFLGYGAALRYSLSKARGRYIVTMDVDLTHNPEFLAQMWAAKGTADIIIGSRYVPGGHAHVPVGRRFLSRTLNAGLASLLALPVHDLSSGFRFYSRAVIEYLSNELQSDDYDVLEEILVRAHCGGWRIREVPLRYRPRSLAQSNARAMKEAGAFLRHAKTIWRLRNNASSCDYDARAFNSRIWPQRYWQRRRFAIITGLMSGGLWLDIACGSSQIIRSHPAMVGFDINLPKLRYLRATNERLVRGTMFSLPFRDETFDGVVCSEVIEHVPKDDILFQEMRRVLKTGGTLILGTPDYSSALWNAIERAYGVLMPASYAEEHISHYTRDELEQLVRRFGFQLRSMHAIVRSELILAARKLPDDASAATKI